MAYNVKTDHPDFSQLNKDLDAWCGGKEKAGVSAREMVEALRSMVICVVLSNKDQGFR